MPPSWGGTVGVSRVRTSGPGWRAGTGTGAFQAEPFAGESIQACFSPAVGGELAIGDELRVLFVCSGNKVHGMAPFVRSQGESLVLAGLEVEYFLVIGRGILGYLKNVIPLARRLHKGRFDVIHAHYSLSGIVALLANRGRLPTVVSLMGGDVDGILGETGRQTWAGRINIRLSDLACKMADKVIVKSANLKAKVPVSLHGKISTVPNGVDTQLFHPLASTECRRRLGLPSDVKLVLFLGNPAELRKGYSLAVRAVEALQETVPGARLISPYRIGQEEVCLYLNACDVLLLCSTGEGSPNVIKEAMACNCPFVSTDVGDARDRAKGCANSIIAGADPRSLAFALAQVLETGSRSNGRERLSGLTLGEVAHVLVALYEKAIREHTRPFQRNSSRRRPFGNEGEPMDQTP